MPIKCLIIDDEPLAIQVIKAHIEQIPDLDLVSTFQNPLKAFEFLRLNEIELIFLDIQMPYLTGLDFVKASPNNPKVIFTTAYRNYALESYELEVVDYLLKPITFIRFFKAVNKYKNLFHGTNLSTKADLFLSSDMVHDHIYVNANKKYIKVIFSQVLYLESIKDYVRIYTENGNVITKGKISEFETSFPNTFLRVHRSFIVNTHKIKAFNSATIDIENKEIPIGNSYKEKVMLFLKQA